MKKYCWLLLFASVVWSAPVTQSNFMENSSIAVLDTIYLDSTEVEYSKAIWLDRGANTSLLIEAMDDSSAGFASDSMSAKVEFLQGFPVNVGRVAVLPSKANPDSTSWPGSSLFTIKDSLNMVTMGDTNCVWARDSVKRARVLLDSTWMLTDELAAKKSGFGSFVYYSFAPDFSPIGFVRLTGKANNMKRGAGSRWILRWYQLNGANTKVR